MQGRRPVPGASGGLDEYIHFVRCQELRRRPGDGIFPRGLDRLDLLLGKLRVVVLDHPERELFQDCNTVKKGILLERTILAVFGTLDGFYPGIDSREIERVKRW